ncbi:MAG: ABC transporter substrate-binding protein [Hyphomicrobiaceae bacterium]|nr:MAG: ABC transporter substrate-binding protein [Hyphomicrobiaceae bacterium]
MLKLARRVALAAAAAILAGAAALMPASAADKKPFKIGLLLSLSGPAAPFGIPERDAVKALTDKLNAEGGVNGRKVELVVYDDATNPTEAARGMRQLTQQGGVVAVIGSTIGSGTLAAAPIAAKASIPVLAPNGTDAVIARDKDYFPWVFRTLPADGVIGRNLVERALAGGARKVGLFYQEDAYGKGMHDMLATMAKEKGFSVVAAVSAPLSATDLAPQATRLRNAEPDVVLLQASAPALGAAFVRAATQVGLKAPIWAQGALGQKSFLDAAGPAAEGVNITLLANWGNPTPELAEFARILTEAGTPPQGFGEILAANAFYAIVAAAARIEGDIDGVKLRDALEAVCEIKAFTPGFSCYTRDNHDGWTGAAMQTAVVRNGRFVKR